MEYQFSIEDMEGQAHTKQNCLPLGGGDQVQADLAPTAN